MEKKLKLGNQMREIAIGSGNAPGPECIPSVQACRSLPDHTKSRLLVVVRQLLSASKIEAADIELLKDEDVVEIKLPAKTLKLALWAEAIATDEDE